MKEKKTNSYKKALKVMGSAMVVGGVLGSIFGGIYQVSLETGSGFDGTGITELIRSVLAPLLGIIFAACVILEERTYRKLKRICERQQTAEDEECDQLEYEEEKEGGFGMNVSVVSQILSILVLTFGYSMKYITTDGHAIPFLAACVVFIACFIYNYFWQIRYVKLVQKTHPEKKGDPASLKFQEQWLESCDEAEKEIIYRSAYKTYMTVNRTIPVLLAGTMVAHLYLDTGIFAVVVVSAIWMLTQFTYTHSCVKLRETRGLLR